MISKLIRVFKISICVVLIAQFAGCGTLFYPERRGQRGGMIDPGVAVLDGVGLLLFIIPGIVAFAVDFGTGTIYLPGGDKRSNGFRSSLDQPKVVRFDPKHCTNATIERIVRRETGLDIKIGQAGMKITRLGGTDDVRMNLAKGDVK